MISDASFKAYSYQSLLSAEQEITTRLEAIQGERAQLVASCDEFTQELTVISGQLDALRAESKIPKAPLEKFVTVLSILCFVCTYFLLWKVNPLDAYLKWFVNIFGAAILVFPLSKWAEFLEGKRLTREATAIAHNLNEHGGLLTKEVTRIEEQIQKDTDRLSDLKEETRELQRLQERLPNLKRRAKERERSAKISAYEEQRRSGSNTVRSDLLESISQPYFCPYCQRKSSGENLHADHIFPVALGGLSIPENMVLVCSECNLTKSNLTLRAFAKKTGSDLNIIYDRLEKLGKVV